MNKCLKQCTIHTRAACVYGPERERERERERRLLFDCIKLSSRNRNSVVGAAATAVGFALHFLAAVNHRLLSLSFSLSFSLPLSLSSHLCLSLPISLSLSLFTAFKDLCSPVRSAAAPPPQSLTRPHSLSIFCEPHSIRKRKEKSSMCCCT